MAEGIGTFILTHYQATVTAGVFNDRNPHGMIARALNLTVEQQRDLVEYLKSL